MFHYIMLLDIGGTWHFIELLRKTFQRSKTAFVDLSQLFHYDCIRIQIRHGKTKKHIFPHLISNVHLHLTESSHFAIMRCIPFWNAALKEELLPMQVGHIYIFIHGLPETLLHDDTLNHFSVCELCPAHPVVVMEGTTGLQYQYPQCIAFRVAKETSMTNQVSQLHTNTETMWKYPLKWLLILIEGQAGIIISLFHHFCLTQVLCSHTSPTLAATTWTSPRLCWPVRNKVPWLQATTSCTTPGETAWIGATPAGWATAQLNTPSSTPEGPAAALATGPASEATAVKTNRASMMCSALPLPWKVGLRFRFLFMHQLFIRFRFCLLVAHSAFRAFLLAGSAREADICGGCAGVLGWRGRDCQGGPHICCVEARELRPLRRRLVGWWKRPLPDLQASQKLQPHRGCRALCWISWQNAKVLRCLLLSSRAVTGCHDGESFATKEQQQWQPIYP